MREITVQWVKNHGKFRKPRLRGHWQSSSSSSQQIIPSGILGPPTRDFHGKTECEGGSPPSPRCKVARNNEFEWPRILEPPTLDFHGRTEGEGGRPPSLEDFDKESDASIEKYATIALRWISKAQASCVLVECGPVALGRSSAGCFLHMNFKARNNHVPGASVETYFAEFMKTNKDGVELTSIRNFGPSSLLPDKANTFGCVYCSSHNIHHPHEVFSIGFRNGREDHEKALYSQISKLNDYLRDYLRESKAVTFSHPGLRYLSKRSEESPSLYATAALACLIVRIRSPKLGIIPGSGEGVSFELVKPGRFGKRFMRIGWLVHTNFKAKNKYDPDAPVQTFFAEVLNNFHYVIAVFCKSLGPSDSALPEEVDLQGCIACECAGIHHPPGSGYRNFREYRDF